MDPNHSPVIHLKGNQPQGEKKKSNVQHVMASNSEVASGNKSLHPSTSPFPYGGHKNLSRASVWFVRLGPLSKSGGPMWETPF